MIPKIIHYCWFGRTPLPKLVETCISSWRQFFPGYEIREWNETNFDVTSTAYTSEAYDAGKYAFVSDYVRLMVLHEYGGLYFDTDVEVIRSFTNSMLSRQFLACEKQGYTITIAPGLAMGFYPKDDFIKQMLNSYDGQHFMATNGEMNLSTINVRVSNYFLKRGWQLEDSLQTIGSIVIYPSEYFCPFDGLTQKMHKTNNTFAIHWYMSSWIDQSLLKKFKKGIKRILPQHIYLFMFKGRKKTLSLPET